jgi:thiol-disulfide isomerase/thioredoxin
VSASPIRAPAKVCGAAASAAPRWITVAAFVLLALLAAALVLQYVRPRPAAAAAAAAAERFERFERFESGHKLVFLYMTGCGWCDRFKPEWAEFQRKYGADLATRGVAIAQFERADAGAAPFKESVKGYPTLLLIVGGSKVVTFEGERTADTLHAFVLQNLGGPAREGFFESEFNAMTNSRKLATKGEKEAKEDVGKRTEGAGAKLA